MSKVPVAPPIWIIFGPVLVIGVIGILLPFFVRPRRPSDEEWTGVFYSNPKDPSLFVPKRFGIGYTLNFGNPWAWVVVIFILLAIALPIILSNTSVLQLIK